MTPELARILLSLLAKGTFAFTPDEMRGFVVIEKVLHAIAFPPEKLPTPAAPPAETPKKAKE